MISCAKNVRFINISRVLRYMRKDGFEKELIGKNWRLTYGAAIKLDKKDKEIIKILGKKGRLPLSTISKKVGLSRDGVRYRIKRLIDADIIVGFQAIINPAKMGYQFVTQAFFSLHNLSDAMEKKFQAYLCNLGNTSYVSSTSGRWDYTAVFLSKNPGHFEDILRNIRKQFPNIIKDFETTHILQEYKYEELTGLV